MKKQKGFTLIELLVVIAIIAVLASILMVNFIGVRQRARDGQREANVQQIQSALELYRADNGVYPASLGGCGSSLTAPGDANTVYMKTIPCDPLSTSGTSVPYIYTASPDSCTTDCSSYTLTACLENDKDSRADSSKSTSCSGDTYSFSAASFTVTNP
jgi:general secretion pathway protein G